VPTGKPGDYDFTPPFDAPQLGRIALFPGWGRLTPFAIDLTRHRLGGPDPLRSSRYARDLNFLKSFGSLNSTAQKLTRPPRRSSGSSRLPFGTTSRERPFNNSSLVHGAPPAFLALMNFAMADAGIACFEGKYRFRFWRPYTAIRRADEDENRATEPDPEWLPLLWTPRQAADLPHSTDSRLSISGRNHVGRRRSVGDSPRWSRGLRGHERDAPRACHDASRASSKRRVKPAGCACMVASTSFARWKMVSIKERGSVAK